MGKGKHLVPCLEDSAHCRHLVTKHGANKNMSYQRCNNCQQEQQMPVTPVSQLEAWNNTLVCVKHEVYQKEKKTVKSEKSRWKTTHLLRQQPSSCSQSPRQVSNLPNL